MPTSDLLARILETPLIERVIPQLPPEVLHRVIEHSGLEECGEIVALATPAQLMRVFDLDLWRSSRPGLDERLDADRFGVWLEVLVEAGVDVAADKVAGLDPVLVVAALAQHVRVFDRAAVTGREGFTCEIGSYAVGAKRTGSWDAIVALLVHLDAEHHECFTRLMRGCRRVSNEGFEIDGLHDLLTAAEQDQFDLAAAREQRRERQGFVSPADARAFLQAAREPREAADTVIRHPIAVAYFRSIAWTPPEDAAVPADAAEATAVVMETLTEAGLIAQPRALLTGASADSAPRLTNIQSFLQSAENAEELAFLANVLISGCAVQGRPFTHQEASEAAAAICNLGLEDTAIATWGLLDVFQIGWSTLYRDVCMRTAKRLVTVLRELRCVDRDTRSALDALRRALDTECRAGTPWRAAQDLDVIMALDMPAWAALVALISECPVMHAALGAGTSGMRSVSASDFEFIATKRQIESIDRFMASLPGALDPR